MKASDARRKAIRAMDQDRECIKIMNDIYKKIGDAASKGKLGVNIEVPYSYHDYVRTKLIEDGYKFVTVFERFEIRW